MKTRETAFKDVVRRNYETNARGAITGRGHEVLECGHKVDVRKKKLYLARRWCGECAGRLEFHTVEKTVP